MKASSHIVAVALVVTGCDSAPASAPVAATEEAANPDIATCEGLTTASNSGNSSLRAAFVSTPEGRDYGGGVIRQLVEDGKYRFAGAEMVGNTCYAYGEARGEQWGKVFNLAWRCPVKVVTGNPGEPGKSVLEVVDDRVCDFDTERGAPKVRDTQVEMIRQ